MREYRKKNPEIMRNIEVKKKYGIPTVEYVEMLVDQKGVCLLCEQPETSIDHRTKRVRNLAVDHNHINGKVRGLLCSNCNRGLGFFRENQAVLQKAIEYLSSDRNKETNK